MKELESKVVVVTGATRGIGKAIAEECVKHGAKVAFTYLSSVDRAKALEAELSVKAKLVDSEIEHLIAQKGIKLELYQQIFL